MRTLSRSVVGAVVLPLTLLPTTAWADTPAPTGTAAISGAVVGSGNGTPAGGTNGDTGGSGSGTGDTGPGTGNGDAPPTTSPTTQAPTPSESTPPGLLSGTLTRTPASGPAGTKIKVASVTRCVDTNEKVGELAVVALLDAKDVESGNFENPIDPQILQTAKDGSWTGTLTAPKTAKDGTTYVILAFCAANQESQDPFLLYQPEDFVVTKAPKAPVATPVTKNPSFTG